MGFNYELKGRDSMRKVLEKLSSLQIKEFSELVTTVWPQQGFNDFETLSDMKDLFKKFIKFAADKYDNSEPVEFEVQKRTVTFGTLVPGINLRIFYWMNLDEGYIGGAGFSLNIKRNIDEDLKEKINKLISVSMNWKEGRAL